MSRELIFQRYACRRLTVMLNHQFPTRFEFEKEIVRLLNEMEHPDTAELSFLYPLTYNTVRFSLSQKLELFKRFAQLGIPFPQRSQVSGSLSKCARQPNYSGLYRPFQQEILGILISVGYRPNLGDLTDLTTPQLVWLLGIIPSTKRYRMKFMMLALDRDDLLAYLMEYEHWSFADTYSSDLTQALVQHPEVLSKYPDRFKLFENAGQAAKALKEGDVIGPLQLYAFDEISKDRDHLDDYRIANAVERLASKAAASHDVGLMSRIFRYAIGNQQTPEGSNFYHYFVRNVMVKMVMHNDETMARNALNALTHRPAAEWLISCMAGKNRKYFTKHFTDKYGEAPNPVAPRANKYLADGPVLRGLR